MSQNYTTSELNDILDSYDPINDRSKFDKLMKSILEQHTIFITSIKNRMEEMQKQIYESEGMGVELENVKTQLSKSQKDLEACEGKLSEEEKFRKDQLADYEDLLEKFYACENGKAGVHVT